MVDAQGIEPWTSPVWRERSPAELCVRDVRARSKAGKSASDPGEPRRQSLRFKKGRALVSSSLVSRYRDKPGETLGSGRLLLAGAGSVVLQRLDALGQRAAALGGNAGGGAVGGPRRFRRHFRFRRQHGLDRGIRSFELYRQFGDFGGDVVDAFAQQRIFHALGRP